MHFIKRIFWCKFNPWLTHRETVLDSLSRDKVCRPLSNVVLASSETTAGQHYIAVNGSKYKTIKKPQIMLRTAPNLFQAFLVVVKPCESITEWWDLFIYSDKSGNYLKTTLASGLQTLSLERESNTVSRCVRQWIKFTPEYPFWSCFSWPWTLKLITSILTVKKTWYVKTKLCCSHPLSIT